MRVRISDLVLDPAIQIRVKLDKATVEAYVEMFDALPPVDVFEVPEGTLLADGFHRRAAAVKLGRTHMEATPHEGGRKAAEIFAVTANFPNAKSLTHDEKIEGVKRLALLGWTQDDIAKATGFAQKTISDIANALRLRGALPPEATKRTTGGPQKAIPPLPADLLDATDAKGKPLVTDTHLARIATAPEADREALARHVVEDGWSDQEVALVSKTLRDPALTTKGRTEVLESKFPMTIVGGEVQISTAAIGRGVKQAIEQSAVLAANEVNLAIAKFRKFSPDALAEQLDGNKWKKQAETFNDAIDLLARMVERLDSRGMVILQ